MENIYKIKIRSNPDPSGLYPSERRYSASTVLGLSVVHIALAVTALLMASLTLSGYRPAGDVNVTTTESNEISNGSSVLTMEMRSNLSVAPCVMSLGALAAGLTGMLAWKRWYIDRNIRWFFCTALLSTLTSAICVFATAIAIVTAYERYEQWSAADGGAFSYLDYVQRRPNVRFILSLNVLIACVLELLWSALSAKVAFAGMMRAYPDDIVISKSRGKIEVNTVHKGSRRVARMVPPDILNHFPPGSKLAKYLPKIEVPAGNLPKAESNSEYQERVRQFLSDNGPQDVDKSDNTSSIHAESADKT